MSNAIVQNKTAINDEANSGNKIDFKMVTFSLGGKDYGVDIMKVKEISKAQKFTFVPNAAPFVRGVYNLRGDIISVVDLRIFFNLPVTNNSTGIENMVILRLENLVMGVIVDSIDKVIGISSQHIQPPHPLFGDINIKYISGVVENDSRLYIILDVDRIFSKEKGSETAKRKIGVSSFTASSSAAITSNETGNRIISEENIEENDDISSSDLESNQANEDDLNVKFISETLTTFSNFYPSEINREWIRKRYISWKEERINSDSGIQLQNKDDSAIFLKSFFSPNTGQLWSEPYFSQMLDILPDDKNGIINVWNPGCGNGYESYSLSLIMKNKYANSNIKIVANDNDLISISTAPGLMVENDMVPEAYKNYLTPGLKGMQFSPEIKESIIFEYHDVLHSNNLPPLDFVVARDILSFMPVDSQNKIISIIEENIKPGGILFLGNNERLGRKDGWEMIEKSSIICYRKN